MSDWIEHDGKGYPTHAAVVDVRTRGNPKGTSLYWSWADACKQSANDVMAYRLDQESSLPPFLAAQPEVWPVTYLKRADVLDAARQAVTVDRAATHGSVEDSFCKIAAIWSVHLGIEVTGAQVALMLAELKVVRAWGNPTHADNWCDLAGYAACGGELSRAAKP